MENIVTDRENTWLSIAEAAEYLGVNPRTVRRYMRLGRLEASRVSNKVVRIRLADIDRFMEQNVTKPSAAEVAPEPKPVAAPVSARPAKPAAPRIGRF
ncbi:helix-turn-helix DNA binding protein [Mycobacterium phage Raela]|uniref:Helix-turn-helix DNA binding protein n=1 Tax=Mycobacterium phage Raela TaxID=2499054 RepID=A0A3S9U930_9CAUD|nr:helix-turn-helix DNA binding protein [Mycobacterium phage Raela]